jgi:hypothetical protein
MPRKHVMLYSTELNITMVMMYDNISFLENIIGYHSYINFVITIFEEEKNAKIEPRQIIDVPN